MLVARKKKTEKTVKPVEKPAKKAKKPVARKKKVKVVLTRGKRKRAIARATIRAAKEGKGSIRVNGLTLGAFTSLVEKEVIREPLSFVQNPLDFDIRVNVCGGGRMGQAQAARTAIARGLVEFTGNEELKYEMLDYDRSLLVEDTRRVEPKKFMGPKARARFTKSYR